MSDSKSVSKFRYDINALRAIAIIGVLLFHYKIKFLKGGFAGVDVFFVISGFLMSKIIITSIEQNAFSFWDYLQKRTKRIVPPLLVLILAISVIGFFLYFPEDFKLNEKNAASSVFFVSNILYWQNINYFAPASDTNILLHTWSLSVEWQFYLIYPFSLLLLSKVTTNRTYLKVILIILTLTAFAFSLYIAKHNSSAAFYLLPTRAWEMLVGGIAFLFENSVKRTAYKALFSIIGYIIIIVSYLTLNSSQSWPSVLTAIPVMGAFLIIIANNDQIILIKSKVLQFIGKISYSLYLWHWPIYVIAQYYFVKTNLLSVFVFTILSIALGFLSFTYIESIKIRSSKTIFICMILVTIVTITFSKTNANKFLFKKETIEIASYQTDHEHKRKTQYREDTCHVESVTKLNKNLCLCSVDSQKNILLIGDSHMGQLSQSLFEMGANKKIHFLQATVSATLPLLKNYQHKPQEARSVIDFIYNDYIPKNANSLDAVIITANWGGYKSIKSDSLLLKGINETVAYLKKFKLKVLILGQTELYTQPYPVIAARDFENNTHSNKTYLDHSAYKTDDYLKQNIGELYVQIINFDKFPSVSNNYEPYMVDKQHVSKYGADLVVKKLSHNKKFLNAINSPQPIAIHPHNSQVSN